MIADDRARVSQPPRKFAASVWDTSKAPPRGACNGGCHVDGFQALHTAAPERQTIEAQGLGARASRWKAGTFSNEKAAVVSGGPGAIEMTVAKLPLAARPVNAPDGFLTRIDLDAAAAALAPLHTVLGEGRRTIGPALAERALQEAHYDGQRKTYDHHVVLLADMMRRGKWSTGSQIAFARLGDRLYLVNGRHRMRAVIEAQRDIEFQVLVVDVQTIEEVAGLYYHFDVATRTRGTTDILNAVGAAEAYGLSKGCSKAVYGAVALIGNGLVVPNYLHDPVRVRSVDHRLDAAKPWWPFGAQYERIIAPADGGVKKKLLRPGTVAVAMLTLKHQPEKAPVFWDSVARNDGLRRGDPRHTFLTDLMNRVVSSGAHAQTIIVPCAAWNAWFEGKTITHIKVTATSTPKLLGTPFDGRRR